MDVKTGLILGAIAVVIAGYIVSKSENRFPSVDETTAMMNSRSDCYARGVAYYKEIGSFPNLSTGEDAISVINKKCQANPELFK